MAVQDALPPRLPAECRTTGTSVDDTETVVLRNIGHLTALTRSCVQLHAGNALVRSALS